MDVTRLGQLPAAAPRPTSGGKPDAPAGPSFGQVLRDSLAQVNALQRDADDALQALATGARATLHDTMLAIQKAELSFRLMVQVRDRIVEAYQEILGMQV
jgi:flagellar hook-basal body complex protein FliE